MLKCCRQRHSCGTLHLSFNIYLAILGQLHFQLRVFDHDFDVGTGPSTLAVVGPLLGPFFEIRSRFAAPRILKITGWRGRGPVGGKAPRTPSAEGAVDHSVELVALLGDLDHEVELDDLAAAAGVERGREEAAVRELGGRDAVDGDAVDGELEEAVGAFVVARLRLAELDLTDVSLKGRYMYM